MKSIEKYLENSLLKHIAIELKKQDIIYEKYGEYDGCEDLIKYIIIKLKKSNYQNITITYNDVKNIQNIIFDNLYIIFEKSDKNTANYIIPVKEDTHLLLKYKLNSNYKEYSIIDKETNRFKNCLIIIESNSFRNNSLESLLEHELTHLFNDYKVQSIGLTSFFDIFSNDTYKRTKEYNQHKHPFGASQIEYALYLMNEYEKNAFISQLCTEIRELKQKDEYYKENRLDANKLYNAVKGLNIYNAYMNIGNFINDYDNGALTKREQTDIIDEWEILYKEKLNINQIFKNLKRKFIKTKQKIESIIPKKIAEEYGLYQGVVLDDGIDLCNPMLKL